jgi:hypothetical protein
MVRNLVANPGETGSCIGLIGIALTTPFIVSRDLGAVAPVRDSYHLTFGLVAGLCFAVGVAQLWAVFSDWRKARLWIARAAVAAASFLLALYTSVMFYGVAVLALSLVASNTLSAVRWELRAYERNRE